LGGQVRVVRVLEEGGVKLRLYEITPCVYLAVYGGTGESFSLDEFRYVVVYVDGRAVGVIVCRFQDCFRLLKRKELDELEFRLSKV
jgi:hypothetical protein